NSQLGALYLEALARALAVGVLAGVKNQARADRQVQSVNPAILQPVQWLDECFGNRISIQQHLPNDPRIERAIQFIEHHFQDKVSLKDLAGVAGLSPYHFQRMFRSLVGISPHEYLIRYRLRQAQQLIIFSAGTRRIADIAVEAGFYDEAQLDRHFRRA